MCSFSHIYINIYPTFSGDICSVPNFGQLDLAHRCGAFRQVWSQNRGTPLFLWRPVPPSEGFVALGMVPWP